MLQRIPPRVALRVAHLARRSFTAGSGVSTLPAIKIVEVGPRDGLQNEKTVIPAETKVELIRRLVDAGLRTVEAGSFVSPKWVPQMASTPAVLSSPTLLSLVSQHPTLSLPVLVPNPQGLSALTSLLSTLAPSSPSTPVTNEIAVFVSATESFSRANLNSSRRTSIERLVPVVQVALARGMTVRGYVSVVAGCPFEGRVEPKEVRSVVGELLGMGCYEVSLGDTIGVGTPSAWRTLLAELAQEVPVEKLAAHCHDTYGTSIASILTCLSLGIRTVDSSIAGLGGCPYSPGATGNVATEDVVYALESSGYSTGVLPVPKAGDRWDDLLEEGSARGEAFARLAEVGEWVSGEIRRENASRAGRAGLARMRRGRELRAKL